jgi:gluconokinase
MSTPPVENSSPASATPSESHHDIHQTQHIWIITGPAGCGKSTVALHLASQLSLPYIEGDEFHPPANIKKMSMGTPLTDADRWDWLIILRQRAMEVLQSGSPGVVLTCSALKRKYRDVIRIASYDDHQVLVRFVYLKADQNVLLQRVRARKDHYMKDDMVQSQFSSLEEPTRDETDCLVVDVSGTIKEMQDLTLLAVEDMLQNKIEETMHEESVS